MFKQEKFIKYLVSTIKTMIDSGKDVDKDRAFEEILRMSEEDGMLESFGKMIKNKVRGSKSKVNSYLAYIFEITTKAPEGEFAPHFKFDLARVSHPDIDIDFDFFKRDMVYEYLINKYGRDKTGNIGTYQTLKAKKAIRVAIKAMEPFDEKSENFEFENGTAKMIPEELNITLKKALEQSAELRAVRDKYHEIFDIAMAIEGLCAFPSKHPAGIVISDVPIGDVAPLHRLKKDDYATQIEMAELEDLGLIKFDILSLKTLSVFSMCTKDIYDDLDVNIDIDNIPVDDRDSLKLIAKGRTDSVFQLEGYGMKQLLKDMEVDTFHDVAAANALFRPGALAAGAHEVYCECKSGRRRVSYDHETLKPIMKNTYGQLIYQEQAMMIAQEFAGFTIKESDLLRKAIGKKSGDIFVKLKKKFIEGAVFTSKVSSQIAGKTWQNIEYQGGYAFNMAHSYAYAMLALQCAYLKTHYPLHYMTAVLNSETLDPSTKYDNIDRYIKECMQMRIKILPCNINKSKAKFEINGESIRTGLASVKGVGLKAATEIENLAPFKNFEVFVEAVVGISVVNKSVVETLIENGALSDFKVHGSSGIERYHEVKKHVEYVEKHKIQKSSMFDDLSF
jgi:DNA polymerase-3 subunit alpha